MHQTQRNHGFTLIEVSLAIVIGLIVLAGAVSLYQQNKTSVQDMAARGKVDALYVVIEEMEARNFALPNLDDLRTAWKTRRPDDYNLSPWGGSFSDPETRFIDGKDDVAAGQEIGNSAAGTPFAGTTLADRGRLYYFRFNPLITGQLPYIWLDELRVFGPEEQESIYRVKGCGVAMLDSQGRQWYYVMGRGKTNASASARFNAEGQIGD